MTEARTDYIQTLARAEQVFRWVPDPEPIPLADISPGYTHPEDDRTLADIALSLPAEGLHRRADIDLG